MPPTPAAASKLAQNAAEEDAAINVRLLTHVSTVTRGKAPPFLQLTKSFLAVSDAAQNGSPEALQDAAAAFQRDMDALELQLNRFQAAGEANAREQEGCAAKQQQLEAQIQQALADIDAKKRELQDARVVRQHNEEYEVIRGLIADQPPRAATQAAIDAERAAAAALRAEQGRHEAALEAKRRSFALLLQCVDDLTRAAGDDDGGGGGGSDVGGGGGGGAAPMQVDG